MLAFSVVDTESKWAKHFDGLKCGGRASDPAAGVRRDRRRMSSQYRFLRGNCLGLTSEESEAVDTIWDGPRNAKQERIWFSAETKGELT